MLGYNAQAVVTAAQIIVAAEVDTENIDRANLQQRVAARGTLAAVRRRALAAIDR